MVFDNPDAVGFQFETVDSGGLTAPTISLSQLQEKMRECCQAMEARRGEMTAKLSAISPSSVEVIEEVAAELKPGDEGGKRRAFIDASNEAALLSTNPDGTRKADAPYGIEQDQSTISPLKQPEELDGNKFTVRQTADMWHVVYRPEVVGSTMSDSALAAAFNAANSSEETQQGYEYYWARSGLMAFAQRFGNNDKAQAIVNKIAAERKIDGPEFVYLMCALMDSAAELGLGGDPDVEPVGTGRPKFAESTRVESLVERYVEWLESVKNTPANEEDINKWFGNDAYFGEGVPLLLDSDDGLGERYVVAKKENDVVYILDNTNTDGVNNSKPLAKYFDSTSLSRHTLTFVEGDHSEPTPEIALGVDLLEPDDLFGRESLLKTPDLFEEAPLTSPEIALNNLVADQSSGIVSLESLEPAALGSSPKTGAVQFVVAFDFDRCLMRNDWYAAFRDQDLDLINPGPEDFAHEDIKSLFEQIRSVKGVKLAVASFGRRDVINKAIASVLGEDHGVFITTPGDFEGFQDGQEMQGFYKNLEVVPPCPLFVLKQNKKAPRLLTLPAPPRSQLKRIADEFDVEPPQIIFFDDSEGNVKAALREGYNARLAAPFNENFETFIFDHIQRPDLAVDRDDDLSDG